MATLPTRLATPTIVSETPSPEPTAQHRWSGWKPLLFQGGQQGKACSSRPCPVCTLLTGKDENGSHLVSSRLLADLWPFPLVPRSCLALTAWPPAGRASSMTSGIGRLGLLNVMPTVTICTLLCTSITYPLLLTCGWKKEESGSVSIAFHRSPSLRKELQCPARLSLGELPNREGK